MTVNRPKNKEELQKREAIGVIRASRFVRKYAQSHKDINVDTIYKIHKEIFKDAWPEIAGKYRQEELSIAGSDLVLPHPNEIPGLMKKLDEYLIIQINELKDCEGYIIDLSSNKVTDEVVNCIMKVVNTTAWLHHKITAIHPFLEGNGRTARLTANLILERYGLVGISVKIEKENKNAYCNALAQIDKTGDDYEPLKAIILEGIIERYQGVAMKYYKA
jgi:fido (protein-threonine AMPylation protein)